MEVVSDESSVTCSVWGMIVERWLSVREEDFWVSLLRVDDFPGSRLVKGETTYTEVVRQITYREVVEDFIPRFWSNLCYLGRLPCKSSGGPLPYGSSVTCSVWGMIVERWLLEFCDRVGIIDGLNPQHIKDAMKNMFGMTLDYTTSYRALLYAQELVRGSAEDGYERLPSYLEQISLANPGSITGLELDSLNRFKYLFLSF
ncbi:hypothetical protein F2Q69_00043407 [Brassica cretica]|uniref:Uncharacterized protein n=1 Tax=Brassica cretica TaxID=69181 RepID=A0A8S9N8A0_BRACR|nr:hypothetical protein F2Q69_00043407 [Brassica cretica]